METEKRAQSEGFLLEAGSQELLLIVMTGYKHGTLTVQFHILRD